MLVVGIDENGFGPKLGPLVVTATLVDIGDPEKLLNSSLKESKKICASGKMKICEMIALSFYKSLYDCIPFTSSELLSNILLTQKDECPSPLTPCVPDFVLPCWTDTSNLLDIEIAGKYLQEINAHLLEIKSIALCPGRFNQKLQFTSSKSHLDYLLFEDLILYFKENYREEEILFLCGRIGGTKDYSPFFNRFSLVPQPDKEEETRYAFPEGGEARFITKGDDKYFPITLSSIVGKYIRELFVEQMNRFFRSHIPDLPYCSGYINATTELFIEKTANLRNKLGIPHHCFLREK